MSRDWRFWKDRLQPGAPGRVDLVELEGRDRGKLGHQQAVAGARLEDDVGGHGSRQDQGNSS